MILGYRCKSTISLQNVPLDFLGVLAEGDFDTTESGGSSLAMGWSREKGQVFSTGC